MTDTTMTILAGCLPWTAPCAVKEAELKRTETGGTDLLWPSSKGIVARINKDGWAIMHIPNCDCPK